MTMENVFAQIVEKIIREQEGNKKEIVEKLVEQYEYLFGQASVEVCKNKDN